MKNPTTLLPTTALQERDIDLLLLEELNVNEAFVRWLTEPCICLSYRLPKARGTVYYGR